MKLTLCALVLFSTACAFASNNDTRSRLDAIRQRLPEQKKLLDNFRAAGRDVSYPLVTYTVLDNFTTYALEDLNTSVPNGWGFLAVNGAAARHEPVPDAHTGQWAARLINKTPESPNVYGLFENSIGTTLGEGKTYTLSVWAKSNQPVNASLTIDASWSQRLNIETTGGSWKRFSKTFKPAAGDLGFGPRVLLTSLTPDLVIDDLTLVEGDQPEAGKNLIANGSFEDSWSAQRVARELADMEKMSQRLGQLLQQADFPVVPRWDGKTRPRISHASFLDAHGRPIFFVGYGHFAQVRKDIEKFPAYGINIVQNGEIGPAQVFPAEDKIDDKPIATLIDELDRAEKAGVAVDFLISPHYMPDWVFAKYPHLRQQRADFFPYSVYAPEARAIVKKFVDYVIPKIKDKPALFSICLSNEPINAQVPDEYSRKAWHAWLANRHGDIATLNARWRSTYAKFDDIPQPTALDRSNPKSPAPIWVDFCRWNDEFFSAFHKDLADMVHAVAPNLPVHVKATTWHQWRAENVANGDEATLLNSVTDINGNDSVNLWSFNERDGDLIERGTKDFAQGWRENALPYDLQRSVHDVPVFNSENHLIFDRESRYVDPMHVRAGLWMGAIHGQSATTLWVWEREKTNPRGDFAGDFMERASCAEAVGLVNLDLNRAAAEVAAIQNAPPDVLILHSPTAALWGGGGYQDVLVKTYTALSFTGAKIGFITERQLEQGKLPATKTLFVPTVNHFSSAAFATLRKYAGRMILIGDGDFFTRDEYDGRREAKIDGTRLSAKGDWHKLWSALPEFKPAVALRDAKGAPIWGVNWQCASTPQGVVINLYNTRHDPMTITLSATVVDVLTNQHIASGQSITLAPLEVRLLREAKDTVLKNATWRVRDVQSGDATGLKLEARTSGDASTCTVIDTTAKVRAVTLSLCVPFDATGGTWCDDPETSRKIEGDRTFFNCSDNAGGVHNEASLYPICVVSKGDKALVLACPPDMPRMVRFVYDAKSKELRAEFDFGLSPIPQKFPSRADAKIIAFEVDAKWAFRCALQKYYELFPDAFERRVKQTGIWLPFGETRDIKNPADFGFAFHEIADSQVQGSATTTADDAKIACGSYLYVEPQTYWQWYKGDGKGSYQQRLAQLESDAAAGDKISQATLVSGIIRDTGKRDLYEEGVAYTPQLPWGCDPNPLVPPNPACAFANKATYEFDRLEPLLGWRDNSKNLGAEGVYVDSMEGWGEILNYNHDHWRAAQQPLTFDPTTKKVALLNFWGTYAWVKEMSQRCHRHNTILLGNDAFFRRWQLAPWVDVPGREYTWIDDSGNLTPVPDERYLFFRAMAYHRPYLMLMNNRYDHGEVMEKYFQRSVFYAVYPSMYRGHKSADEVWYWSNPDWYNRDRPLFKKYVPMVRKLDDAGWEPIPFATAEPQAIRLERYGSFDRGNLAFTVHNTSTTEQTVTLIVDRKQLNLPDHFNASTWMGATMTTAQNGHIIITLPADAYDVISLSPTSHP